MPRSSSSISRWRHPEMEVQSKCGRLWKHRKYWISISRTPSGTYRVSSIKLLESRIPNATSKYSLCKNSSNTNIIIIRKNRIWTYHNASLHRSSLMCLPLRKLTGFISRWRRRMNMDYSQNKRQLAINYLISQLLGDNPKNNIFNSINNISINTRVAHQNLHSIKEIKRWLLFPQAKQTTLLGNIWTRMGWTLSLVNTRIENQSSNLLQKWE